MPEEGGLDTACPSCGEEVPEGSRTCPSCGFDLEADVELELECPDCGAAIPPDARDCPSCGAQFILDGAEEEGMPSAKAEGGAIDEMLEAAVKETIVTPRRDEAAAPTEAQGPAAGSPAPGAATDWIEEATPDAAAAEAGGQAPGGQAPGEQAPGEGVAEPAPAEPPAHGTAEGKEEGAEEGRAEGAAEEAAAEAPERPAAAGPPKAAPAARPRAPAGPRRYAGGFTRVGLVFVILAGVALVLTIVALRWDAISSGSKYEAIGSIQSLVILLGLAGFAVCAAVSVYDLLRSSKGGDERSDASTKPASR